MEPEDSSPPIQAPATWLYPDPDQTNPFNKANIVHAEGTWCKILSQISN